MAATYTGPESTRDEALKALLAQGPALVTITLGDGTTQTFPAVAREFSSGGVGFYAQGKVSDRDGRGFQVGIQVSAIGSKHLGA